jgi:hypothetical protein
MTGRAGQGTGRGDGPVSSAMLAMGEIDVAGLEAAYAGPA